MSVSGSEDEHRCSEFWWLTRGIVERVILYNCWWIIGYMRTIWIVGANSIDSIQNRSTFFSNTTHHHHRLEKHHERIPYRNSLPSCTAITSEGTNNEE